MTRAKTPFTYKRMKSQNPSCNYESKAPIFVKSNTLNLKRVIILTRYKYGLLANLELYLKKVRVHQIYSHNTIADNK